jgi:hypothetical protein
MKIELENLIMEEENRRNKVESDVNNYQMQEHKFIKRRNNSCSNCQSQTASKSISTVSSGSALKIRQFKDI